MTPLTGMTGIAAVTGTTAATRAPIVRQAVAEVRANPRRLMAVVVAIAIGVGYLTAAVAAFATENAAIAKGVTARIAGADVVVQLAYADPRTLASAVDAVTRVAGVRTAESSQLGYVRVEGASDWLQVQTLPSAPALQWAELTAGRWPTTPSEVALGAVTARQLNLRVGSTLTLNDDVATSKLVVTGLTDESRSLFAGLAQNAFVVPGYFSGADSLRTASESEVLVVGDGTADDATLAADVGAAVGGEAEVETASAYAQSALRDLAQGTEVFEDLLLIFGAIALLVSSIMIVNTFTILLAQRRRQVGLIRAIGASGGQVRRGLLVEAVVVAGAGALLGVALGVAVTVVIAAVLHEGLVVPPLKVALLALAGLLVAVAAAVGPALRATRVSPLEALRPVADAATARRGSVRRIVVSALLIVAGLPGIALAFTDSSVSLLAVVAGSFVTATGLLLAAGTYLPLVVRIMGSVISRLGVTARLAVQNTTRNPARVAATGAALMLAVGLVVTLQVGASSTKTTIAANIDARFPVDVTVTAYDGPLPAALAGQIAAIPGIAAVASIPAANATLDVGEPGDINTVRVLAPGPDAAAALPRSATTDLDTIDGTGATGGADTAAILADPDLLLGYNLRPGDQVTVTGADGAVTLPVRMSHLAPAGTLVVSPATLQRLDAHPVLDTVWASADPHASITTIRSQLQTVAGAVKNVSVDGSLTSKATYFELLDNLLMLTTALLAVAVLIALIGVGNTLGLSVLERRRESALLRALGLQARQLRWMLAIEAILLGLTGTVVGLAAGAFFGWVGTNAISRVVGFSTVEFSVSLPQTLAIIAVVIVAGVAASVLPARRAVRAAPVDALADV